MSETRFERAARAFDAAHAEDPRTAGEGSTVSVQYHAALARWVDALDPDAPEVVRLAARAQHIRRWTRPRSEFPEGPAGYKRWRSQLAVFHGEEATKILTTAGYGDDTCARVRDLLLKKKLRTDPEVQLLEDAICLTFLEHDFEPFAAKHEDAKIIDILQKTWGKMSERGHAAALKLAPSLPAGLQALVGRALEGS